MYDFPVPPVLKCYVCASVTKTMVFWYNYSNFVGVVVTSDLY